MLHQSGFGIIEIIVAMGLFVIISATGAVALIGSFSGNRLGNEETEATLIAQEGMEAARSIRNQDWDDPFLATDCSSGCGISSGSGSWAWSGSNNVIGGFTRTITVSDVQRNGSGDIVSSGGTDDPDTKQVTTDVTWNFSPTRQNTVTLMTYVTNFVKAIGGDWSNPSSVSSINVSGNQNGWKVATAGSYAYVVRTGGNPDFMVVDISNTTSPSIVGSLNLSGGPRNVAVSGNYAYVASSNNSQEVQVIDISNPSSPNQVASVNLSGNANAQGIYVSGNSAYIVRSSSGSNEFYIVNITVPTAPIALGNINLGTTANEVYVSGNYAYVASDGNSNEVIVVDVSNTAAPSTAGSLNLSGNTNAETVAGSGSYIVVGQEGNGPVHTISISSPTSPSLLGTYTAGNDVNDISLDADNNLAFLASDENSAEFQVLDISTLSSPSLLGSLNIGGDFNGIAYSSDQIAAIAVGDSNSQEIEIIEPQ